MFADTQGAQRSGFRMKHECNDSIVEATISTITFLNYNIVKIISTHLSLGESVIVRSIIVRSQHAVNTNNRSCFTVTHS
jgi:hypothetical protein